jgi:hypothetical protein
MKLVSLSTTVGRTAAFVWLPLALLAASLSSSAEAAGTISFNAAKVQVFQGATQATLTLARTDASQSASIMVDTNDGTLQKVPPFAAGLAGVDYVDFPPGGTVVNFTAGELTAEVNVTLVPKTGMVPNKRFIAYLTNPVNATIGAQNSTSIEILASDTTNPTLTVTAPSATATTVSAPMPYVIKGVAGDSRGIDRVEVKVNFVAVGNAVLGASTVPTAVPYSLPVSLLPGALNTIEVTAYDLRGNSTSVVRNFTFVQRYILTVTRVAPFGIAVGTAGTVTLSSLPLGTASTFSPAAVNGNPKSASIVPGSLVKLTALPKPGYIFSHWEGVPQPYLYEGNRMTFVMPFSDVPGVTAHFVVNPFLPGPGQGNQFYGLMQSAMPPGGTHEGFITGTLTPATGLFIGKIILKGVAKSFIAYFYGNGTSLFNVGTFKHPDLHFADGTSLKLQYAGGAISAIVTAPGIFGPVPESDLGGGMGPPPGMPLSFGLAFRAAYSISNTVPADLLNLKVPAGEPEPNKGYFTVGFRPNATATLLLPNQYPQGDGFMMLTLNKTGTFMYAGTLADGTSITGSSGLTAPQSGPFFSLIATPGAPATAPKGGSIGGMLIFDTTQPDSDVSGSLLRWFRPAVTPVASPPTVAAATNLYTAGWPTGISVDAVGALYDKTLTVETSLGLGAPNAVTGNGKLVFSDGKLTSTITKTNFNISGNTVTKIPATHTSFSLTLNANTGGFSGTFTPNWTPLAPAKPMYKGIIIQKGGNKAGFGFFLSNAKNDADPESGGVTLSTP